MALDPGLVVLVTAAFDRLVREMARVQESTPTSPRPHPTYERQEGGSLTFTVEQRTNWAELAVKALVQTRNEPEIATAARALTEQLPPQLTQSRHLTQSGETTGESTLIGFALLALTPLDESGMPEPNVDDALAALEAFLTAREFVITHRIPLSGVRLEGARIDVADGIVIVPVDEAGRRRLWARLGPPTLSVGAFPQSDIHEVVRVEAEVRISEALDPSDGLGFWGALQEPAEAVIESLRLTGPGPVDRVAAWNEIDEHDAFLQRILWYGGLMRPFRTPYAPPGADDWLDLAEADPRPARIFELRRRISDLDESLSRSFELAMRRFASTFSRSLPEDKIIDSWVALEALFLPEAQELSYRAKMRIAAFLSSDPEERIALAGQIKRSYELRSKIVHGVSEHALRKYQPLAVRADELVALLRRALRLWLEPGAPRSGAELDRLLLE